MESSPKDRDAKDRSSWTSWLVLGIVGASVLWTATRVAKNRRMRFMQQERREKEREEDLELQENMERISNEVGMDAKQIVREQVRIALKEKLVQSKDVLIHHWNEKIGDMNDEDVGTWGEGFSGWWLSAPTSVKIALVQSARELVRARIASMDDGGAGSMALDALCPEFADSKLEGLCAGDILPKLYVARIHQSESTRVHDLAYVRSHVEVETTEEDMEVTVDNRQLLVYTVLTDILVVFKHMAAGT